MTGFRGFGIATGFTSISTITQLGRIAEESGLDYLMIPEMPNDRSAIIRVAAVANVTERIKIGTGIISPYTRHLSSIAADAIGLNELSHGRFMLGLGTRIAKMEQDLSSVASDSLFNVRGVAVRCDKRYFLVAGLANIAGITCPNVMFITFLASARPHRRYCIEPVLQVCEKLVFPVVLK